MSTYKALEAMASEPMGPEMAPSDLEKTCSTVVSSTYVDDGTCLTPDARPLSVPEEVFVRCEPGADCVQLTWFYDEELLEGVADSTHPVQRLGFEVRQQSEGVGGRWRTRVFPCPSQPVSGSGEIPEQKFDVRACQLGRTYRFSVRAWADFTGSPSRVYSAYSDAVVITVGVGHCRHEGTSRFIVDEPCTPSMSRHDSAEVGVSQEATDEPERTETCAVENTDEQPVKSEEVAVESCAPPASTWTSGSGATNLLREGDLAIEGCQAVQLDEEDESSVSVQSRVQAALRIAHEAKRLIPAAAAAKVGADPEINALPDPSCEQEMPLSSALFVPERDAGNATMGGSANPAEMFEPLSAVRSVVGSSSDSLNAAVPVERPPDSAPQIPDSGMSSIKEQRLPMACASGRVLETSTAQPFNPSPDLDCEPLPIPEPSSETAAVLCAPCPAAPSQMWGQHVPEGPRVSRGPTLQAGTDYISEQPLSPAKTGRDRSLTASPPRVGTRQQLAPAMSETGFADVLPQRPLAPNAGTAPGVGGCMDKFMSKILATPSRDLSKLSDSRPPSPRRPLVMQTAQPARNVMTSSLSMNTLNTDLASGNTHESVPWRRTSDEQSNASSRTASPVSPYRVESTASQSSRNWRFDARCPTDSTLGPPLSARGSPDWVVATGSVADSRPASSQAGSHDATRAMRQPANMRADASLATQDAQDSSSSTRLAPSQLALESQDWSTMTRTRAEIRTAPIQLSSSPQDWSTTTRAVEEPRSFAEQAAQGSLDWSTDTRPPESNNFATAMASRSASKRSTVTCHQPNEQGQLVGLHTSRSETRVQADANHSAVPYCQGDFVHIWSNSQNAWMTDGTVERVLATPIVSDGRSLPQGMVIPAGSVLVTSGAGSKWVLPENLRAQLRKAVPVSFVRGQAVHVWSNSQNSWMTDGIIVDVSDGRRFERGEMVPQGAVKVSSTAGEKWVLPEQLSTQLRSAAVPAKTVTSGSNPPLGAKARPSSVVSQPQSSHQDRLSDAHNPPALVLSNTASSKALVLPQQTARRPSATDPCGPTITSLPRNGMPQAEPASASLPGGVTRNVPGQHGQSCAFQAGRQERPCAQVGTVVQIAGLGLGGGVLAKQEYSPPLRAPLLDAGTQPRRLDGSGPVLSVQPRTLISPASSTPSSCRVPQGGHRIQHSAGAASSMLAHGRGQNSDLGAYGSERSSGVRVSVAAQPSQAYKERSLDAEQSLDISGRMVRADELQQRLLGRDARECPSAYSGCTTTSMLPPPPRGAPAAQAAQPMMPVARMARVQTIGCNGVTGSLEHVLRILTGDGRWQELTFSTRDDLGITGEAFLRRHGLQATFKARLVETMRRMITAGQAVENVDIIDLL